MTTPDWPTIGVSVAAALTTIAGKIGWDAKRGGGSSALKDKVDAHIKDAEGQFKRLFDTIDTRVVTKLDAIQADVSDTKERISKVEGYLAGRKDGLTEA